MVSNPLESKLVVFAGMPRTASTSLFHILGDHPQIFRPYRKEMGYFLFQAHKGEDWYRNSYKDAAEGQICIDVTPEYFFSPETVDRMKAFGDGLRVVIAVREPTSFAVSLHREYAKRYAVPPLQAFINEFSYRRGSAEIRFSLRSGVIRKMIECYRKAFGGRLLLYDFAAFCEDPLDVLNAIEGFAGIERHFSTSTFRNLHLNTGNRRNLPRLSRIASAEPLIGALAAVAPASWLRAGAKRFYSGIARTSLPAPPVVSEDFTEDQDYIDQLFDGRVIITEA